MNNNYFNCNAAIIETKSTLKPQKWMKKEDCGKDNTYYKTLLPEKETQNKNGHMNKSAIAYKLVFIIKYSTYSFQVFKCQRFWSSNSLNLG